MKNGQQTGNKVDIIYYRGTDDIVKEQAFRGIQSVFYEQNCIPNLSIIWS